MPFIAVSGPVTSGGNVSGVLAISGYEAGDGDDSGRKKGRANIQVGKPEISIHLPFSTYPSLTARGIVLHASQGAADIVACFLSFLGFLF